MKILFIGDIVAGPGRDIVKEVLPQLRAEHTFDLVIANGENLAHGRGATIETLEEMRAAGVDYFTSGDHIFWQKGFSEIIDSQPLVRPANYPDLVAGKGYARIDLGAKGTVLILNVMGRTSFGGVFSYLDDPFKTTEKILQENSDANVVLIDFHGEATSEKAAFGFYFDGKVDAIVGTHTHVPTCDNRVLPNGTLFVTDVGMTGNIDSVLGVKKEIIIQQLLTAMNQKFEWESTGKKAFRSVIIETESKQITRLDM